MKRTIVLLLSMVFVIVPVTTGIAGSSNAKQITGNVTAIDTKSNTVTITKKNKEVILGIEEKTKIIQCTKKTAITDIKIGDKITAKYKEIMDKNAAKSIVIREIVEKDK